ncbi:hypothetical protein [Phyllobacterium endophyticum]|uniref:Uncharacterized protein n=1 Tax=Phyllobacterium endophyticum TaxID=1149773 RepID=A0A2P7ARN6_9HYPH|nr:hypothetical protein [Phyllobacterium endophyticum]MBB3237509.1 hypothetical protein [Phyllobacterium endophyticum]PSH56827.1 hypothetical protein CU100_15980 [Phyllobacterium endophyticum]TYR44189.1 hypothetical protein FY050_03270 [Phyllobacterium endophyticum]
MSTGSRLIVVEFDRADNDELVSAYDPMQFDTPEEAVSMGLLFNCKARRRSAMEPRGPTHIDAFGLPTALFACGEVAETE